MNEVRDPEGVEPASKSETHVTVTTGETWAFTDWGRGSRAARKLLKGTDAELDQPVRAR